LMNAVLPITSSMQHSAQIWGAIIVLLAAALLWSGVYRHLEIAVTLMVGVFSISALAGLMMIQGTGMHISAEELATGLTLSLGNEPRAAGFAVIRLIGALGVTSNELFMYPYWILEKGYAHGLGDPSSTGWVSKARQRIRILRLDAILSTALATVVTAAFYMLGAAVLHRRGSVPSGLDVVDQISRVFTESYGPWSYYLFMVGAFCTLFSTLVVVAAASGRMWCDMLCSLGYLRRDRPQVVRRCHQVIQLVWLAGLLLAFLAVESAPVEMVLFGQFFAGAFMTPLLVASICWLAFRTDARVRMSRPTSVALIASAILILVCVIIGLRIR
jgi:manganese transport protein